MSEILHPPATYQPIEDYAVIGDLYTVALVGKNGSIDWCCLPHFDSPSVFGALLDAHQGGFFRIAPPCGPGMSCRQLYVPETNILITRFLGSSEGTFTACSFWLAESLARAGRLNEARLLLEKMLTYCNHVGLYAEEIGPTGEALGNYPQAVTHLSLITACYHIDQALNQARVER